MKTIITLLLLTFFTIWVSAQYELPVTFENLEEDTAWAPFANGDPNPENFVLADNPDNGGINTSDFCIKFIVVENADPWVGAWSDYYGPIDITEENRVMQMMVYKDVITDCYLKLELTQQEFVQVIVPNTVTNDWELLIFDFTDAIGTSWPRLVFFPDFPATRESGSTCYIDNIGFYSEPSSVKKVNKVIPGVYPNPAHDMITVQYPEMRQITISNLVGQRISSMEFQPADNKVVEISTLESGVYFITLDTSSGIVCTRFVKQ